MAAKRAYSKRAIKILALQRVSRMITLLNQQDILMPSYLPEDEYPYQTEIMLECMMIGVRMATRMAELSMKEWPNANT
jgi:hypothetical protein